MTQVIEDIIDNSATELAESELLSFKIFFLCEDQQSLTRANALKDRLRRNCDGRAMIEAEFCEYARLCHPRLRQEAVNHAVEADMLIISARGTDAVPVFVQNWMNEIGSLRPEKIVCAEFLDTESCDRAEVFHRFIDKWASQTGGFLFSNLFPGLTRENASTSCCA